MLYQPAIAYQLATETCLPFNWSVLPSSSMITSSEASPCYHRYARRQVNPPVDCLYNTCGSPRWPSLPFVRRRKARHLLRHRPHHRRFLTKSSGSLGKQAQRPLSGRRMCSCSLTTLSSLIDQCIQRGDEATLAGEAFSELHDVAQFKTIFRMLDCCSWCDHLDI